jgi:hypothetical protein
MKDANGNAFDSLTTPDGLAENEGVAEDVRDFLRIVKLTYAGYNFFHGPEPPTRIGLVLDLLEKISNLQEGTALQLVFRPFRRDPKSGEVKTGEPFVVKVERTGERVPVGEAVAAGDPCCAWVWDPTRKAFVCTQMC